MAELTNNKKYKYHVKNLHTIEIALSDTALSTRNAIRKQNEKAITSFTRLFSFLLGAWIETRLKKLLYEKDAFLNSQIEEILNENTQFDQWLKLIEVAFKKHYQVRNISKHSMELKSFSYYQEINNIFNEYIKNIIEIRNKLAHGQWVYTFNNNNTNIEQEKYRYLMNENIQQLQLKQQLVNELSLLIHDLVVSVDTFERDFENHYKRLKQVKINLVKKSYTKYKENLINKYQRGLLKRNQ